MRLEKITGKAVDEYLKKSDAVLIPVGSIENHGRHMALGTDTLIPNRIAELIEQKSGILMAPTVPYGATDNINGCMGTISIGTDGLTLVLSRIVNSLYRYGFRRFIILNGHGGNSKAIETVGLEMHKKGAYVACLNWWLMAGELRPEWKGGHGGAEETAGLMGVDPALVDICEIGASMEMKNDVDEKMPSVGWNAVSYHGATVVIPRESRHYLGNGWYGQDAPTAATPEWGREMLSVVADYIVDFIADFERIKLPEDQEGEKS